jgi:hypothetical protein
MAEFVVIEDPSATDDQRTAILAALSNSGGEIVLGLGPFAAIVDGSQSTQNDLEALTGNGVLGVLIDASTPLPAGLDAETEALIAGWAQTLDPDFVAQHEDPGRDGGSWDPLAGCGTDA